MTFALTALLVGWFWLNAGFAISRQQGSAFGMFVNALLYGLLAAAVVYIYKH